MILHRIWKEAPFYPSSRHSAVALGMNNDRLHAHNAFASGSLQVANPVLSLASTVLVVEYTCLLFTLVASAHDWYIQTVCQDGAL